MTWFRKLRFEIIVIGLYFFTLAFMIKYYDVQSFDIKVHIFMMVDYLKEGSFPSPPGYYAFIYAVDAFLRYKYPFVLAALLSLTFFFWIKFRITTSWLQKEVGLGYPSTFFLVLSMAFLSPIFIPAIDGFYWYLGKFTPTIWHNSTVIAVFPFSILLFFQTLKWLETEETKTLYKMASLGLVILLIKPSFLFCYIPSLPLICLANKSGITKQFWVSMGFSTLLFGFLLLEKYWIFEWDPMIAKLYTPEERSAVVLDPLRVHLHFSAEPVFDFLSSFPSTIVFLVFWGKRAFRDLMFNFSLMLVVLALAVYLLLAETGFRQFHGNFYWQIPIALFLHYLSMVKIAVQDYKINYPKMSPALWAFIVVYSIQVAMGITYWQRIFTGLTLS